MSAQAGLARRRWWRRGLLVAGSVIAVLAAVAAGFAVGRSSAPGPDIVVAAAPVVADPPEVESMPLGVAVETPSETDGAAPQLVVSAAASYESPLIDGAGQLSDTTGQATGYRVVNTGLDGSAVATALARVLGVSGSVVTYADRWLVGSTDGIGPAVTVVDDAAMSWSYSDPAAALAADKTAAPIQARATTLASSLLGELGVDVSTVDWQVDRGNSTTSVIAWQLVEGQRTRLGWRVVFGPDASVTSASGFAAGLEELPDYVVVGARTAVDRSTTPPWSHLGAVEVQAPTAASSPSATPTSAETGRVLTVMVPRVTVTDARLGLAQYWQPDGQLVILPSYILTADDGSEWSLIAVANGYVDFVERKEVPSPQGGGEVR